MDLGFRHSHQFACIGYYCVSILGLMDLGFRLTAPFFIFCLSNVSILGLMDLGFRLKKPYLQEEGIKRFNPWFNGFRF